MQVRSVGQEDSMEEEMATHSRILAQEIPMDRGAWQVIVHEGHTELGMTECTHTPYPLDVW